jgi:hypothetical protein
VSSAANQDVATESLPCFNPRRDTGDRTPRRSIATESDLSTHVGSTYVGLSHPVFGATAGSPSARAPAPLVRPRIAG